MHFADEAAMSVAACLHNLPLACRNRPLLKTRTGPLPFDEKDKGPSENLCSRAADRQYAARLSGC